MLFRRHRRAALAFAVALAAGAPTLAPTPAAAWWHHWGWHHPYGWYHPGWHGCCWARPVVVARPFWVPGHWRWGAWIPGHWA